MRTRTLGAGGPVVAPVGLGSLALTGGYGRIDRDAAVATVRAALDLGMNLLDTADFYGGGEIERLVGAAIAGRREQVVLATRGGAVFTDAARPTRFDGSPSFLRQACEDSLRRLGVDHIDVYYLARLDQRVPIEESMGGLADLVAEGKIGHIGLSEVSTDELTRAHRVHPVAALQSEYSLWRRDVEPDILPTVAALGIGFVAHTPLGRGFLSTSVTAGQLSDGDYRRRDQRFAPDALERDTRTLAPAAELARRLGLTTGQLALAWLLARDTPAVVPIPGTRDPAHLAENLATAETALSPVDIAELAALFPPGTTPARDPRPQDRPQPAVAR